MTQNIVSLADGNSGYGLITQEQFETLKKALEAGTDYTYPSPQVGGFALRAQSLERTLHSTLQRMEHYMLYKMLPKVPAKQVYEEYNRVTSFGNTASDGFVAEVALPEVSDSSYERVGVRLKFMGTTGVVSYLMSIIPTAHGPAVALETNNKTMDLLRKVEVGLIYGDSSIDNLQWDGYKRLVEASAPATHIYDSRGATLTQDNLVDATVTPAIAPSFGKITHIVMNPLIKGDIVKAFFPDARYDLLDKPTDGTIGLDVAGFQSPMGRVAFVPNVFVGPYNDGYESPPAVGAGGAEGDAANRPGIPTLAIGAGAGADGTWPAADVGQTFTYEVVAYNEYGHSGGSATATGIPVDANDHIPLTITNVAGGALTRYFKVFRSRRGGGASDMRLIARVAMGVSPQVWNDVNATLPHTSTVFCTEMTPNNLAFSQLGGMVRIPLATTNTSIRWMQLFLGAMKLYTPRRNFLFKNVGRASDAIGFGA